MKKIIAIDKIDDFNNHPFVVSENNLDELVESIRENGLLVPLVVREKEGDRYEMISGHRRKLALKILGVRKVEVEVKALSDNEAIIYMGDSNLYREKLLPSEKAFAYKMKLDAIKHQGKRSCTQNVSKSSSLIGKENTFFVHCTLIPLLFGSGELKTKPTQNSVKDLRNMGITPNALVCRVPYLTDEKIRSKLSLFCSVPIENIIDSVDVDNIYQIPINYYEQHIDEIILKQFNLPVKDANLKYWYDLIETVNNLKGEVKIALVGKYIELHDAYLSVHEALIHAGYVYNKNVKVEWIDSESLEKNDVDLNEVFKNINGILVPGGFGSRGIEGKIKAINYARVNDIPFLGICLGMQLAVIEFARNVCGIEDANSTEFEPTTKNPIIDLMADQKSIINKGGTLRLGNYECTIERNTLAYKDYKQTKILERHRHRYEFNNKYRQILEKNGMVFSGINESADLVEIIELPEHKHFIASQFHPEFKSRPTAAHPLFLSFVKTSISNKK